MGSLGRKWVRLGVMDSIDKATRGNISTGKAPTSQVLPRPARQVVSTKKVNLSTGQASTRALQTKVKPAIT